MKDLTTHNDKGRERSCRDQADTTRTMDPFRAGEATIDGEPKGAREVCSYDLAISGNRIYACNYLKNQIEVVRRKDMMHIGSISGVKSPHGIAIDGDKLVVAGYRSRTATWITTDGARWKDVFHQKWMPVSVAMAEDEYYFADYEGNRIVRMKMSEDEIADVPLGIALDQKPHAIKIEERGKPLVITARSPGKVIIAKKRKPLHEVDLKDADPLSAVLTPVGIVITCYKKGTIEIVQNVKTESRRLLYQSDGMPTGLAYYQGKIYFSEERSNLLGVLDLRGRKNLAGPSLRC